MKIVILTPQIYGECTGHGGGVLSFGQLTRLARRHELHFVSFMDEQQLNHSDEKCITDLREICSSVTLVPLKMGRIKRNLARIKHIFKLFPVYVYEIESKRMKEQLANILRIKPDIVLIQFPQMAQYVTSCSRLNTVLDVHDAYSVSAFRLYRAETVWWRKIQKLWNWLSWVRYEAKYYPLFTKLYTLTLQDSAGLRIFSPGIDVDVIPAAVDVPTEREQRDLIPGNRIGFVGSSAHTPNVDAIRFFLAEIFPIVLDQISDAEFCIAGNGHSTLYSEYDLKHVNFLGHVESIRDMYQSCQVIVVPLRSGGGVKIKTIEAMAHGCPIVSTSIGIEESGAKDGIHAFIADSQKEFAENIVLLLKDTDTRERLSRNAKELAIQQFSWESRTEKLERLLVSAEEHR